MSTTAEGYPRDWDERRQFVYQRDGYECQNCGARGGRYGDVELHAHHIVPKSRGGTHDISNLVTLCHSCHDDAHDHHVPRGDSDDSASNESGSASDDGHVLNVENLQHMYKTGEIDFDEFENRLERSLEERGLQRDTARDGSDSTRDESQSTTDESDEATSPLERAVLVGGITLVLVGTIVEGVGFLIGFIFFTLFVGLITALV